MTGERAASMTRLGDTYTALAVDADQPLNAFVPATKYAEPRCRKCGKEMQVALTLPRTDIMPAAAVMASSCSASGEPGAAIEFLLFSALRVTTGLKIPGVAIPRRVFTQTGSIATDRSRWLCPVRQQRTCDGAPPVSAAALSESPSPDLTSLVHCSRLHSAVDDSPYLPHLKWPGWPAASALVVYCFRRFRGGSRAIDTAPRHTPGRPCGPLTAAYTDPARGRTPARHRSSEPCVAPVRRYGLGSLHIHRQQEKKSPPTLWDGGLLARPSVLPQVLEPAWR
jgi:hypothetical protein